MVSAFVIAVFSFVLGNYVIPPANETMNQFTQFYIDNNPQIVSNEINIHRQIEPGVFIYMRRFSANNVGDRFTMEKFNGHKLTEKITADNIRWDDETGKWILNNWWKRTIYDLSLIHISFFKSSVFTTSLTTLTFFPMESTR